FYQAEDGIRYFHVTGVQTCALPIWKVLLEVEDVPDVGAAPAVDRLVVIPDDHDIASQPIPALCLISADIPAREQVQPAVLRAVRVLVLVHEYEAEAAAVGAQQIGACLEQLDGFDEQVVEIERVLLLQRSLVRIVDVAHDA